MRTARALLPLLIAAAFTEPAGAVDIYHWVDESGVPHYSQWAPPEDEPGVETVTVQNERTAGLGGDVYPVDQIAQQTAEIRAQREEERAGRRDRAQPGQASPVVVVQQPAVDAAWPLGIPGHDRLPKPHRDRDRDGRIDDQDEFGPRKGPGRRPGGDRGPDDRGPGDPPSLPFRPPGDSG